MDNLRSLISRKRYCRSKVSSTSKLPISCGGSGNADKKYAVPMLTVPKTASVKGEVEQAKMCAGELEGFAPLKRVQSRDSGYASGSV